MPTAKIQFIVDSRGVKKAVILPILDYNRLLEDRHDRVVAAKRRDEECVSLAEVRRRLQEDGFCL